MTRVQVSNLTFGYGAEPIFADLSLELTSGTDSSRAGHVYAVMGLSGSGKTTLFRLIAGILQPWTGSVKIVADAPPVISYLPQKPIIFEHLSRRENAMYFDRLRATRDRFDGALLERMITRLRLQDVLNSDKPATLMSGGELQRLSLLRAISIHPHVLLLDEPCTGLDVPVRDEFLMSLRELTDAHGLLVLYITHHADEARLVADRIVFLSRTPRAVEVIEDSFDSFVQSPPSSEAVQMLSDEPTNVVSCQVEGTSIECLGLWTAFTSDSTVAAGPYQLGFGPATVKWSTSGIPVNVVGTSGRYSFVRPATDPALCLVLAPEVSGLSAVRLEGDAFLFPMSATRGGIRTRLLRSEAGG